MSKYPVQFKNEPSPQQQAIFDFVLNDTGNLVVQATAGAGKSSTLIMTVELLAAQGFPLSEILFVAFNKAIVNELQEKLPQDVKASTMHAFGMQVLKEHLGTLKVEGYKYSNIIKELLADEGIRPYKHKDYREISDGIKELVNCIRLNTLPYDEMGKEELLNLLEDTQPEAPKAYAGLICSLSATAITAGIKLAQKRGEIDFTDMLYLPWKFDLTPQTQYALVLSDESQDTNTLQRWLIMKAVKPGGRILCVGDANQAIYGFAGATPDSMNILKKELDATELPLSVTWRCPHSHVELAQAIVGAEGIQAAPSAKEGIVAEISPQQFESQVKEGDVILSRTNRPLISQAFGLLKVGRRAKIRGREIGAGLVKAAEGIVKEYCRGAYTTASFLSGVQEYYADKSETIYGRKDLNEDQIAERIAELVDRTEVLSLIAENTKATSFDQLKFKIDQLFDDSLGDFILLSTIHKAKGLEFDRVYILEPEKLPAPFARSEADKKGEVCVAFVALTRAKKEMYFIGGLPGFPALQAVMAKRQNDSAA